MLDRLEQSCGPAPRDDALRRAGDRRRVGGWQWRWPAGMALAGGRRPRAGSVSTIVFNVPITLATGKWDADNPPADWKQSRDRWEFFQALRSWLLLIGFGLVWVGAAMK